MKPTVSSSKISGLNPKRSTSETSPGYGLLQTKIVILIPLRKTEKSRELFLWGDLLMAKVGFFL